MRICSVFVLIVVQSFANAKEDDSSRWILPSVQSSPVAALTTSPVQPMNIQSQTGYPSSCQSNLCNYFPSTCGSCYQGYQYVQPITVAPLPLTRPPQVVQVPVQVPKVVPKKVMRTFSKQQVTEVVPMEQKIQRTCPYNFDRIEGDYDDELECTEQESKVTCPPSYEWEFNRCVEKNSLCVQEYIRVHDQCVPRIICPQNYIQRGNECIAPEPYCQMGYRWNGKICESERLTCANGYKLSNNNQCIRETYTCPINYKKIGNQCVKEEASCPSDYRMVANNICEKSVNTCPTGSYDQYGQCVTTKYVCPAGSTTEGDHCTVEETTYDTVHEV
jgi:hypothetical protein